MAIKKHNMHAVLACGGRALAQADAVKKIWLLKHITKEKLMIRALSLAAAAMEPLSAERERWIREVGLKACAEAFATSLKNAGYSVRWPEPTANGAEDL
jgi:hypothetical protein